MEKSEHDEDMEALIRAGYREFLRGNRWRLFAAVGWALALALLAARWA